MPDRTNTHGEYIKQATVAEELREVMGASWTGLPRYQRAALTLVAEKLSRILTGDCNFEDHWIDIAGYCECVLKEIRGQGGDK